MVIYYDNIVKLFDNVSIHSVHYNSGLWRMYFQNMICIR